MSEQAINLGGLYTEVGLDTSFLEKGEAQVKSIVGRIVQDLQSIGSNPTRVSLDVTGILSSTGNARAAIESLGKVNTRFAAILDISSIATGAQKAEAALSGLQRGNITIACAFDPSAILAGVQKAKSALDGLKNVASSSNTSAGGTEDKGLLSSINKMLAEPSEVAEKISKIAEAIKSIKDLFGKEGDQQSLGSSLNGLGQAATSAANAINVLASPDASAKVGALADKLELVRSGVKDVGQAAGKGAVEISAASETEEAATAAVGEAAASAAAEGATAFAAAGPWGLAIAAAAIAVGAIANAWNQAKQAQVDYNNAAHTGKATSDSAADVEQKHAAMEDAKGDVPEVYFNPDGQLTPRAKSVTPGSQDYDEINTYRKAQAEYQSAGLNRSKLLSGNITWFQENAGQLQKTFNSEQTQLATLKVKQEARLKLQRMPGNASYTDADIEASAGGLLGNDHTLAAIDDQIKILQGRIAATASAMQRNNEFLSGARAISNPAAAGPGGGTPPWVNAPKYQDAAAQIAEQLNTDGHTLHNACGYFIDGLVQASLGLKNFHVGVAQNQQELRVGPNGDGEYAAGTIFHTIAPDGKTPHYFEAYQGANEMMAYQDINGKLTGEVPLATMLQSFGIVSDKFGPQTFMPTMPYAHSARLAGYDGLSESLDNDGTYDLTNGSGRVRGTNTKIPQYQTGYSSVSREKRYDAQKELDVRSNPTILPQGMQTVAPDDQPQIDALLALGTKQAQKGMAKVIQGRQRADYNKVDHEYFDFTHNAVGAPSAQNLLGDLQQLQSETVKYSDIWREVADRIDAVHAKISETKEEQQQQTADGANLIKLAQEQLVESNSHLWKDSAAAMKAYYDSLRAENATTVADYFTRANLIVDPAQRKNALDLIGDPAGKGPGLLHTMNADTDDRETDAANKSALKSITDKFGMLQDELQHGDITLKQYYGDVLPMHAEIKALPPDLDDLDEALRTVDRATQDTADTLKKAFGNLPQWANTFLQWTQQAVGSSSGSATTDALNESFGPHKKGQKRVPFLTTFGNDFTGSLREKAFSGIGSIVDRGVDTGLGGVFHQLFGVGKMKGAKADGSQGNPYHVIVANTAAQAIAAGMPPDLANLNPSSLFAKPGAVAPLGANGAAGPLGALSGIDKLFKKNGQAIETGAMAGGDLALALGAGGQKQKKRGLFGMLGGALGLAAGSLIPGLGLLGGAQAGMALGSAFAEGGQMNMRKFNLVGEKGPELVTPGGGVVPLGNFGRGSNPLPSFNKRDATLPGARGSANVTVNHYGHIYNSGDLDNAQDAMANGILRRIAVSSPMVGAPVL